MPAFWPIGAMVRQLTSPPITTCINKCAMPRYNITSGWLIRNFVVLKSVSERKWKSNIQTFTSKYTLNQLATWQRPWPRPVKPQTTVVNWHLSLKNIGSLQFSSSVFVLFLWTVMLGIYVTLIFLSLSKRFWIGLHAYCRVRFLFLGFSCIRCIKWPIWHYILFLSLFPMSALHLS